MSGFIGACLRGSGGTGDTEEVRKGVVKGRVIGIIVITASSVG